MERYKNRHGGAEILGYELSDNKITLWHRNGWLYEYTEQSAGTEVLNKLRKMAMSGSGLSRYLVSHAHSAHARRYREQ